MMWQDAARIIRDNLRFVLTTHIHPEGDAIGSEIAMAAFLQDLGKDAAIVNSSPTPQNSVFMDPRGEIKVYPVDYREDILSKADAVVILDVNNWPHLGPFADAIKQSGKPRLCIDHHEGADVDFADIMVTDTSAAATGVMIYDLIQHMDGEITPRIAQAVYASIITDTGTFRFSNTDERVFRIATELTGHGVDPFTIHRHIFSKTPAAVKLLGAVLNTVQITSDGKLAWIHATRSMFDEAGADYEDSDGLLDIVRSIKGVEFCFFFKELPSGRIKVSLRSNGRVDVYQIARSHGGGGHRMAAGMSVDGPMEKAIQSVITACSEKYLPRG